MKKALFISVILFSFVTIYSCNNDKNSKESDKATNEKEVTTSEKDVATEKEVVTNEEEIATNEKEIATEKKVVANDSKTEVKKETTPENPTKTSTGGKPIHLTKELFIKLIMDYEENAEKWVFIGDLPCIIDFYADWCRPCRMAAPVLEELAKEYEGKVNIYKVDTEAQKELAGVFGIQSLPSFLYCPMTGSPQLGSGIGRTTEETKAMFVKMINEVLLKK